MARTAFEPKEIFVMYYKDRLKCIEVAEKSIGIYWPVRNRHEVARARLKNHIKYLRLFRDQEKVEELRREIGRVGR